MEEFIASFHSLTGTTIGERRRSLFCLFNKTRQAESKLDFVSLKPQTPLEEKFKVEALIYFHRTCELVEVLKSENPILIKKALKAGPWFLKQAFQDITGEQLVSLVFPYISFNAKVKIVNILASHLKDTQKSDEFFKAINEKYGLYLASKLLSACSKEVVVNCIESNRIKLTPRQLLAVIKRYPEITESILELLKTNRVNVKLEYKNVFIYLSQNDALLFSKLLGKYELSLKLGRRATDRFIRTNKQKVLTDSATFYELFHIKQIAKSLKEDFNNFFVNLFPTSLAKLDTWYPRIFSLIKLPSQRLDLLFAAFEKTYHTELWEHPKYVYPELLEMLPPSERENRLKIEYKPYNYTEDDWNCYWKIEKSIPYLKKRISLSSDNKTRAKLVSCLVETCRINKDKVALTSICKYITAQHRNDHIAVRLAFLTTLQEKFKLENLEEEHWMYVHELIQVFTLNNETFYENDEFLEAYIRFRLANNLPIKEELTQWLKTHCRWLNILEDSPQYQKQCLLLISEIISELYKDKKLQSYNLSFLQALIKWNKKHPNDKISPFDFGSAIGTLKDLLTKEEYVYSADTIMVYCLQQKTNAKEKTNLLNLYLKPTNKYADIEVMNWLIQYEPLTVANNISTVTQLLLKMEARTDQFIWKHSRNYTHLEIPQKLINNCFRLFEDKSLEGCEQELLKSNVIMALSYITTGEVFQKFIAPHYPLDLKVNVQSEDAQKMYRLQKTIGASLKNIIPASQMFNSVLAYCKGDYLKLVCVSLYSVAYKANEDKLTSLLSELSGRAVSVRKHELHLAFRVMDKAQIYKVVNKFMTTEKNASVRKFIVKGIFNFFVKNPNDYLWELVQLNVNSLDVKDKEAFSMLLTFEKIPRQYIVQYILFTWNTLSKLPYPESEITSSKVTVLNSIPSDVIQLLPKEFCHSIIQNYLFKEQDLTPLQMAVHNFTCNYIVFCNSQLEKEDRLKLTFLILKDYISTTWHNTETRTASQKSVTNFVKEFCVEFLEYQCNDKEILSKFIDLWNCFLKPHKSFNAYLRLQLTLICTEKLPLSEAAQKLKMLCDSLTNMYGSVAVSAICDQINWFPGYICPGVDDVLENNKYDLFESLVQPDSSTPSLLLVILLLNSTRPTMPETKVRYNKIIEILDEMTDPVIQLYLNNHFLE